MHLYTISNLVKNHYGLQPTVVDPWVDIDEARLSYDINIKKELDVQYSRMRSLQELKCEIINYRGPNKN